MHLYAASGLALHCLQVPPRGAAQTLNLAVCPFGSPLTKQARQSATGHRLGGRPSSGGQRVETALPRSCRIRQNHRKSNQGSKAMPRPSIIAKSHKACLFSPALASATSLTGRSSGHQHRPWLRHSHGLCWCPPHLRCSGAPYLGVRLFGATRKHNARP